MSATSLELSSLRSIKYSDAVRYRKNVKPFGTNTINQSGSPYLKYKLPRVDVLDGHNMKHYLKVEADGDAASDDLLHSNVRSIWKSLRVSVGSEDVQSVNQIGHLSVIRDNLYMKANERTTRAVVAQGIPALAVSGVATKYGHHLLRGGFLDNLIPLYKVSQIEIEFELNQVLAEHTDATTAVTELEVSSAQLTLPMIRSAALRAQIDAGEYQISYTDWNLFEDTSLSSGATSHTVVIPAAQKSVTGLILTMRNTADINDPNFGGDLYQNAYVFNGLAKFHVIIDGEQIPKESIDCTSAVELYDYMAEFAGGEEQLGNFFDGGYDTATDGKFVLFFPLTSAPFDRASVSGTDLNSKTGQIQLELSQMNASVNSHIRGWLRYDRIATFGAGGQLVISK